MCCSVVKDVFSLSGLLVLMWILSFEVFTQVLKFLKFLHEFWSFYMDMIMWDVVVFMFDIVAEEFEGITERSYTLI